MTQWPSKIEKGVGGNMSQLPDEILECILNKLILRDAVRAGLVSSRWRHLVLSRPCLVFKTCSLFQIEGASEEKCVCSEYKDRFVGAVYEFIASYRGARMKRLFVRFCLKTVSTGVVSDWMRFALDLGVEEVKLEFYCKYFKPKVPLRVVPHKIPIEFSPSKQPVVVKYLELSHCNAFTLSLFTQLKTLKFHHTCLYCHDMESVLSSGLVNLKTLKFSHSKLPPYLSLNSLPSLKHFLAWLCSGLEKIDVASLKLNSLEVICKRSVSLGLTQVPNLKVLSYTVDPRRSLCHIFTKLPQILPRLTTLNVHSRSHWIEYMPESIATFSSLRRLRLALGPKVGDIMFKIVQFLKSYPLLSHLAIVASPRKEHEKLECIDEYHHEHLEWITVREFVGTKYQIECCKYLLKLAPHAKQLILEPGRAYCNKAGHRIHPPFIVVGLGAPSQNVRHLACKTVSRLLDNADETTGTRLILQHDVYPLLLTCLIDGDEQVATAATDAIKKLAGFSKGLDIIFPGSSQGTQLGDLAVKCTSLGRVRVLALIVKLFSISSYVASKVYNANLLSLLEKEVSNAYTCNIKRIRTSI